MFYYDFEDDLMNFIGYIILGVLLFLLITYYKGKCDLTKIQVMIFSLIYLLFVAGISSRVGGYQFNEDIFMVIVVEAICQLIYISYFLEKNFFNKEDKYLSFYVVKIILAFFINQELINKVKDVFLSGDDFKIIIWLCIIVYLYQFFKGRESIHKTDKKETVISKESIALSFTKLKLIYGENIASDRKLVIYAIMIFNHYKRPKVFRIIDSISFKITNKPRKLGIMQVMSKKYINDYESIDIVSKKIDKLYEKNKDDIKVINLYDKSNGKEIQYIYEEVRKFCKL